MQELVSVCVVTFNNEKYVEETLESIKNQTYKSIELIISDDNSSDCTLNKVSEWIKKNNLRFVNIKVLSSDTNKGVSANCNKAIKSSTGHFVKIIGDDLLKHNYIEKCVDFFNSNSEAEVLCTEMDYFYPEEKFEFLQFPINFDFFKLSAQEQKKYVKSKNIPHYPTPSIIYKRSVFNKVGFFDESIPMWEDGPMYFKLAINEIKVHMLNESLVDYRLLKKSLSNTCTKIMKKNFALYGIKYVFPNLISENPIKALLLVIFYFVKLIVNF